MSKVIKTNCEQCNLQFDAELKEIKRGNGKYCSKLCFSKSRKGKKYNLENNAICAFCKIDFHKPPSKLLNTKSKSGLYFCCREHKDQAQRIGGIKEIMPPHYGTDHKHYRNLMFKILNKPKICERCNYNTNEAAIIVHHKDRNRENNSEENLEVLCCNCHAIEHWSKN